MNNLLNEEGYFIKKRDTEMKRIDKFEKALSGLESSNTNGIRIGKIHLANLYLNCVKLTYSIERSIRNVFPYYIKFLNYYKDICTSGDSFYDIIDILSIEILLKDKSSQFIGFLKEIVMKFDSDDGMIVFLMDNLENKNSIRNDSIMEYYNDLLNCENKEKILMDELEIWYDKHRDAYWYDSHKLNNNTYCGYWCFEIAALAKIFNLDDEVLSKNQYYPYDKY